MEDLESKDALFPVQKTEAPARCRRFKMQIPACGRQASPPFATTLTAAYRGQARDRARDDRQEGSGIKAGLNED